MSDSDTYTTNCNWAPTLEKLQLQDHVTAQCDKLGQKPLNIKTQYTSQLSNVFYHEVNLQLHSTHQRNGEECTEGGDPAWSKFTFVCFIYTVITLIGVWQSLKPPHRLRAIRQDGGAPTCYPLSPGWSSIIVRFSVAGLRLRLHFRLESWNFWH